MDLELIHDIKELVDSLGEAAMASFFGAVKEQISNQMLPIGPLIAFFVFGSLFYIKARRTGMSELYRANIDLAWIATSSVSLGLIVFTLGYQSSVQKVTPLAGEVKFAHLRAVETLDAGVSRLCHLPSYSEHTDEKTCDIWFSALNSMHGFGDSFNFFKKIPSHDEIFDLVDALDNQMSRDPWLLRPTPQDPNRCTHVLEMYSRADKQLKFYAEAVRNYREIQSDYQSGSLWGILRVILLHLFAIAAAARLVRSIYDQRVVKEKIQHQNSSP